MTAEESAENEVPELPGRDGDWLPEVVAWWGSVWRSPMASEYLDADMKGGLYLLADLHQARWVGRNDPAVLRAVAAEIRLQEVRFGLSPIDRSRLRWEVAKGDKAGDEIKRRRWAEEARPKAPVADPRSVLKLG